MQMLRLDPQKAAHICERPFSLHVTLKSAKQLCRINYECPFLRNFFRERILELAGETFTEILGNL